MATKRRNLPLAVLLADDHQLLLNGIRHTLESSGAFSVVAEATSVEEVMPLVRLDDPDVVFLDSRMNGMDGLACLDEIKASYPDITVVVLSASFGPDVIEDAFNR